MAAALQELGRQRDEAMQAVGEWEALAGSLQQQVADLQQELQQQYQRQPSVAQSSQAEGSWASGSGGGGDEDDDGAGGGEDAAAAAVLAGPTAEGATALRAMVATSDGVVQTTPRLSQLQHPELVSCSMQTSARGTPRKRESAGHSARGGGASASGEAAAAAAASPVATAALVLELQRRLPTVLQQVLGGADGSALAEEPGMRGGVGPGSAAEAASAAVEVVRYELLRCLAGLAAGGGSEGGDGANVLVLNTVEPAATGSVATSARALAGTPAAVPTLNLSALAQGQQPQAGLAMPAAGGAAADQVRGAGLNVRAFGPAEVRKHANNRRVGLGPSHAAPHAPLCPTPTPTFRTLNVSCTLALLGSWMHPRRLRWWRQIPRPRACQHLALPQPQLGAGLHLARHVWWWRLAPAAPAAPAARRQRRWSWMV